MTSTTRHGDVRCQQRGLSPMLIDLLLQYGSSEPAGDGVVKLFIDKAARKRIRAYAGSLASKVEEHLDVYVVVGSNGQLITAAHRTERIRRH